MDAASPTSNSSNEPQGDLVALPMSSTPTRVPPMTSVTVTSRPSNYTFHPRRVVITEHAEDWVVNDVLVDDQSQLGASGDLPGDLFAASAVDNLIQFTACKTQVAIVATYVGADEAGAEFCCEVQGIAVLEFPCGPLSTAGFLPRNRGEA